MKLYEGTKRLRAKPMTRGEYNAYRGFTETDLDDPGYLVEYEDGGKANDPRHTGYISWSPADVFERTYKRVLQPYQQRVVEERDLLDARRDALSTFLEVHAVALPPDEQERMVRQRRAMAEYSAVLAERIAAFN